MNLKTAKETVAAHTQSKRSDIAKAVDVLYQEFGTYQAITHTRVYL